MQDDKWIHCPECGIGIKFFLWRYGTRFADGGLEILCRKCKRTILVTDDGMTKVLKERSA